jgi:hypothetical protein
VASDELLKRIDAGLDRIENEFRENRRFQDQLMARMERWSLSVEARMIELSNRINDQGDLIRAQTKALQRVLDRLPPATS